MKNLLILQSVNDINACLRRMRQDPVDRHNNSDEA